jgi:hypothetical protein
MAILFDMLTLVQTGLAARGLVDENGTPLPSGAFIVQTVPSNRPSDLPAQPSYPVVIVAPFGPEGLDPNAGTTSRDDVVYKIVVAILAKDQQTQGQNLNLYLGWRQSIRQLFHNQPLPNQVTATVNGNVYTSGTLAFRVEVQPLEVVDREAWFQRNLFASGNVLNLFSREPRG